MKLLTKEILATLPPLHSQDKIADPMVHVKFFDPQGSWTWYVTEYDPKEGLFFGLVKGMETELGYFSLEELSRFRGHMGLGIERDLYFSSCLLSEVRG